MIREKRRHEGGGSRIKVVREERWYENKGGTRGKMVREERWHERKGSRSSVGHCRSWTVTFAEESDNFLARRRNIWRLEKLHLVLQIVYTVRKP